MMSERDAHPDEGTIHAWLDRQLDDTSAATLEAHLQRCDECAERVAEARGLIAGASRIVASLDDPSHAAAPRDPLQLEHPAPAPPRVLSLSHVARFPAFRITPARSAIAAVLVVAVGLAILHEHEHPTSELAREKAIESAAAPSAAVPMTGAPAIAAAPTTVDTTAGERVATARTFAKAQRETTVNADLARTRRLPTAAAASPLQQTIAASKAADSAVDARHNEAVNAPLLARSGTAAGAAAGVAAGVARAAAPAAASTVEAPQCYRVESATGAEASWGDVALPFVLALDAPATRNTARVLTGDGKESDVRAVFEHRAGDSLLFTMRRIGYTGTLAVGEPGDVRAGVMRSAPSALALDQVVVTAAPTAEPRRAMRAKASAAASREDSTAAAQRRATPAVPVVVRKVPCGR